MGGSSWSDDFYNDRVDDRKISGTPTFHYDAVTKAKAATDPSAVKTHKKLDPYGVKVRESRDSDAHPNSVAIGVLFDVTGSMRTVPKTLQAKLPLLMGLLGRKGYVEDPQILMGAIGDEFSDRTSLQVGQFESGIEMDEDLTNIYLEGGGGGSNQESYQNAMYFFARHTVTDCFEKRGHKGYLFMIGDESPYDRIDAASIKKIIGDDLQADIPTKKIVEELQEKWNVFFVIPKGTSNAGAQWLTDKWVGLLGSQNVINLDNAEGVCEAIGLAIGYCEGTVDGDSAVADLTDAGVSAGVARSVTSALDGLAKSTAMTKGGTATGTGLAEKSKKSEKVTRL